MAKIALLVTAAGLSTRFGGEKKEFFRIPTQFGSLPVITAVLESFVRSFKFSKYVVTIPAGSEVLFKETICQSRFLRERFFFNNCDDLAFVVGGDSRQESVFRGLVFLKNVDPDFVLIHDGARPYVSQEIILDIIENTKQFSAAAPGIPSVDTQKIISADGFAEEHLNRDKVVNIQTPQGFDFEKIFLAHEKSQGKTFTDDTEIFAQYYGNVKIIPGEEKNKKITFRNDLMNEKIFRVGNGFDLHRLEKGRNLVLGGVNVDGAKGCVAHSDGDVLIHAIIDALLGACTCGDIGEFFPPDDPKWKNASSAEMLRQICANLQAAGWNVENIDCVICTEGPKILPLREKIRESLASIMEISTESIFVKGKTAEGCGEIGRHEAMSATVVSLLSREIN